MVTVKKVFITILLARMCVTVSIAKCDMCFISAICTYIAYMETPTKVSEYGINIE